MSARNAIRSAMILLMALLTTCTAWAAEGALDPGGVSFEWPAPGSWNPPRKVLSANLLQCGDAEGDMKELREVGGWFTSSWLGSKAKGDYPLPGTPTSDIAEGKGRNGSRAFHLLMSADADPIVTAVWATNVKSDKPGPYRVSGWVKCGPGSKDGGSLEVTFQSRDASGKLCGEHWQRQRSKTTRVAVPPKDWHPFHVDVMAMPGIGRISLIFAQRGPGELYFDDVSLVRTEADPDLHVIARTTGVLDGTVAIGSKELFCGGMWLRNETERKVNAPRLEFDLPDGVHLVAPDKITANDLREEKVVVAGKPRLRASIPWTSRYNLTRKSFFSGISQLYCLYAELPPRAEPYRARARLTAEGYEGPWWEFKLSILPRIEPVTPPKRILLSGIIPKELEGRAARELVEAYSRWGMNSALCCNETDDLRDALENSNLYMVNIDWFWRNNFQFMHKPWTKALVPKDGWWVGQDGGAWGMCPEYIAQGKTTDTILKPYYRTIFVESNLYDAWATNWEPNLWIRKGCFCPRCKKAFAAFARIPEAEVADLEGRELWETYPEQWQDYRRDLNNRLMRLAYKIFADLSAERGQPIPPFLWVGPGAITNVRGEMDLRPVLRECECIAGWSYEGVDISEGCKGIVNHLKVAEQTEEVMEAIRELNNRPDFKYFHCVLGSFGALVNTPEEMELDFLCSALARPWSINAWELPLSYDYRYAKAFARACRLITAHEDIIYDGEKSKDVPITPLSQTHTGEETRKNLWARSFSRNGKRLYAIFNFDRRNDVFFTLKPETGAGTWILHDPVNARAYTSAPAGPVLAPSDVKYGICLHLGAARAMFLVLQPYDADSAGKSISKIIDCRAIRAAFDAR